MTRGRVLVENCIQVEAFIRGDGHRPCLGSPGTVILCRAVPLGRQRCFEAGNFGRHAFDGIEKTNLLGFQGTCLRCRQGPFLALLCFCEIEDAYYVSRPAATTRVLTITLDSHEYKKIERRTRGALPLSFARDIRRMHFEHESDREDGLASARSPLQTLEPGSSSPALAAVCAILEQ